MAFKRAVQRYGRTPEPETPFQRAGQMWDDRIGSARVQARNWRIMALGGLLLSTGLSGGLIWQSLQSRVTPYVVEVDKLGETLALAPASADFQPTDPQIAWHLGRFITNIRAIMLDSVVMRENWVSAYDFATPRGSLFLSEYASSADPFANIGERTVSVQVTSVIRASDRSFQVKWIETSYERGSLASSAHWTALVTIIVRSPRSAETLRKNPLGLYVDAIDWSRELETPAPVAPVVAPSPPPAAAPATVPAGSPLDPNLNANGSSVPTLPERSQP
ncbi:conjugal transfer protein TrbF [Sphingomonas sp.]|uniref:conjugal transfer protein TrbF n=1 Tax=Sphingomonas sp. TaxID=28214 RepID=UPI0025E1F48B|nr:conjugal transfer protein TrbF [Sphingomonas sp.]